jgi:hypothetical protein
MIGATLAANGVNKDQYIDARRVAETSLREKIQGKTAQEQCNIIDAHIAGIEKIIEEQKILSFTARAVRAEVIEGMTEEDRQIRRNMKVPRSVKAITRETKTRVKGTPEEMLKAFMAKYPSMSEAAAKDMLGLD